MGNCFGSEIFDPNPSSNNRSYSSRPSTPDTSKNYSSGVDFRLAAVLVLGVGGVWTVFKGWVDEKTLAQTKVGTGMVVAIKKLNSESMQGFEEWQAEVNFLGRLSHPNLVKLLGYCWEDKELLLVYEFMPKGSLENHLFRRSTAIEPLSWELRLKIAIGAARGLAFLHSSEKQIIYRDFKASNILLDGIKDRYKWRVEGYLSSFEPCGTVPRGFLDIVQNPAYAIGLTYTVAGVTMQSYQIFGLAKVGPSAGNSHVTTRVMGTYGYAAPEYIATGHLYVKSDVYGFGVSSVELLTGLRALDTKPPGKDSIIWWTGETNAFSQKEAEVHYGRPNGRPI
ncbi:hypothetical protein HAX54_019633 [Datura stramonium]|uniref:Protein kinase domain-containing protein n=1 Tax=Datura stramonium TaxID=4076 RepID=A0ABS8UPH8_DATST|nr:hypothetical protein [Datura stramonium]